MSLQRISHNRGLTLIEVMIGMVIGLIGIVIIAQVYLVNENYKRSTTSAGGAQVNGAIALYSIERDLRGAGYGLANSLALDCGAIQYFYNGTYSSPPGGAGGLAPIVLAPVVITDGGAGPDTITIMYSTSADRNVAGSLTATMPSPSAELTIDNTIGYSDTPGDLVLVSQGGVCTLMQVTQVQTAAFKLQHNPGGAAPWNPAGGGSLFTAYTQGAAVFNLGRPIVNRYSINTTTNNVELLSMFTASSSLVVPAYNPTAVAIVNDIVDLQAQYGKDNGINNMTVTNAFYNAGDGIVDSYDNLTPTNAAGWQQVLSVRIGVLARSQNYEKPEPPGSACTATTTAPSWVGGNFSVPGGIPSCYKYRVFETVVPLRNQLWRQ